MSKIIGIDLGTTNSCVALLDERGPRVLASPEGERTTPSVVSWTPAGDILVGLPARRQAITNPAQTIFGAKRLVGRKVNADDVTALARVAAFRVVAAPNGDAWVRIAGVAKSPQEIASHVLRRMRAIAEAAVGEPVTRAVVTVPAYFDLTAASAYNSEMVKQKVKIMKALNLRTQLEDMLITLGDQIHLIKMVTPTSFVYLAADRASTNLAIVRNAVNKYAAALA